MSRPRPLILVVLDGWGMRDDATHNAIRQARTPYFSEWWRTRPHALLRTSGLHVGLPAGQMGNSEVGHMNLGAGRVVYQDLTRINLAMESGALQSNKALQATFEVAGGVKGTVHLWGLLSPGGVHSHQDHFLAVVQAAREAGLKKILIHAVLDGRDTPPRSARAFLTTLQEGLDRLGAGRIATVCGRYFAMDRDKRWDRVQLAYDLYTRGEGLEEENALAAVEAAYARGEDDEFVRPTRIRQPKSQPVSLADGDALLLLNFRADRAREICHALLDDDESFRAFARPVRPALAAVFSMTRYDDTLSGIRVAFPPESLDELLGGVLARNGLKQLRAAETEKYAHVTYFFNGGIEAPFPGEDRLMIPSPKVATYDAKPEMSARELTEAVVERIHEQNYDFILVNFANPDMVGHTGRIPATVQAIETVDGCLGEIHKAIQAVGGEMLITADHGNADQMVEVETGQPHTAHTNNPAPLLYLGRPARLRDGLLCDVAPTILTLLDLPRPEAMSGTSLVTFTDPK
ncbi:MAG: 2,3-bisphosphoglycerate-independent phosphoglycerate mutase [Magnetococcales bacterium]|nr:2,3-bisphosphoglycerate-independent phosphoglycerate mutase [Magnetococcales bacterium]